MTEFEQIYREHFDTVYRFLIRLCRNEPLAEELAQETFFRAMRSLGKFDGRCRVDVWLCQIAKNAYYSHYRKQKDKNRRPRIFWKLFVGNKRSEDKEYVKKRLGTTRDRLFTVRGSDFGILAEIDEKSLLCYKDPGFTKDIDMLARDIINQAAVPAAKKAANG